jgi:hypothetical protein
MARCHKELARTSLKDLIIFSKVVSYHAREGFKKDWAQKRVFVCCL